MSARNGFDEKWMPEPTTGCHLWIGATVPNGYGQITAGKRHVLAHRFAWEREHGPVPRGLQVLHRCDTRACVNPAHLFLGTQADNMRDMVAKGRHYAPPRHPTCVHGHAKSEDPSGRWRCKVCDAHRSRRAACG